jgi:hypothetical protein
MAAIAFSLSQVEIGHRKNSRNAVRKDTQSRVSRA